MDLPDCIDVCSFSTTSPSWIRSWLTLMPVISVKARASVLDSYSWVVMVSDTTLISLTPLALSLAAAPMNHRSEEHTYELHSLTRITHAVFCLTNKKIYHQHRQRPYVTSQRSHDVQCKDT